MFRIMDNYCGNCKHIDKNSKNYWNEYYCNMEKKYLSESKKACSYFVLKDTGGYQPAGCFITTIVCSKLGFNDDCEVLTTLRGFRENYLKRTDEGIKLLMLYDEVGPKISNYIAIDSSKVAQVIMNNYLIPCTNFIKEKGYMEAINLYKDMVYKLLKQYNIMYIENYNKEVDMSTLGKARIKVA